MRSTLLLVSLGSLTIKGASVRHPRHNGPDGHSITTCDSDELAVSHEHPPDSRATLRT